MEMVMAKVTMCENVFKAPTFLHGLYVRLPCRKSGCSAWQGLALPLVAVKEASSLWGLYPFRVTTLPLHPPSDYWYWWSWLQFAP